MGPLEAKVQQKIKEISNQFSQIDDIEMFEKTLNEFEELVNKGIIKRRGNHLLSVSDAHLKDHATFNTTK